MLHVPTAFTLYIIMLTQKIHFFRSMKKTKLLFFLLLLAVTLPLGAQTRDKMLTIQVTTGTGDNLEGQPVSLVQTDYTLSYGTLKLDADGTCQVKVYAGNHQLTVDRPGYEVATQTFNVPENESAYTVSLQLTEKVRTPFALNAQPQHDAYTGENSVLLTWNTEPPAFFDDFEQYEPFAISFGEWTGIDADQEAAAPIVGDYPNRCVMQYAQIINPLTVSPPWWYDYPILQPYSGKQYVGFTRTSSGNANDDWLISPVITVGAEQVLAFMGKAADKYPERFQVYVTTQTDNPVQTDFERLDAGNYETADMTGWRRYEYSLAAYAGKQVRFAIRYISHYNLYGSFMLMVDDVFVGNAADYDTTVAKARARRSPAHSEANPNELFHISLDGVEVAVTPDYSCIVSPVTPGPHTLGVKAVYLTTESETVTLPVDISADYAPVTFLVSAQSVLSPDGQQLLLINTATTDTYTLTVSGGSASIASLPYGEYVVHVEEGAFNSYQQSFSVTGDTQLSVVLTDRVVTPFNITADVDHDNHTVVVRWNQELGFSDSFEEYEDFATGSFGPWKSIDMDQMPVYPIALGDISNIVYFPGAGDASNPKPLAPIVFNPWSTEPPMLPTDEAVKAPTGDKTVAFFSPQRAWADKWLISPAFDIRQGSLLGVTLKSYSAMYPESVEFCVSDDSEEPSDFTVLSTAQNIPADQWTRYETDLSDLAGRRVRLAVHYVSYDTFFLQLDDFTVGPGEGEATVIDYGNVLRYDIYLDGVKVGESTAPSYTLTGLADGVHTIGIVAVYQNSESEMGTVTVNVTAGVAQVLLDADGSPACFYTVEGVRMGSRWSDLPKGVYVVKTDNQYKKVLKR